jgi:hypothetical protein
MTDAYDRPLAVVKGVVYRAIDPRLPYLMPHESTVFGKGTFDPSKVKGLTTGSTFILN